MIFWGGSYPTSLLEHKRHVVDRIDPRRRIAVDHDEVCLLASNDRPDERTAVGVKETVTIQRAAAGLSHASVDAS